MVDSPRSTDRPPADGGGSAIREGRLQKYILRRLILMVPTMFGLTLLVFVMLRLLPGDIVTVIQGEFGSADKATRDAILKDFQLDEAVPIQYVKWVGRMVRFDLGKSLISGRSVQDELSTRVPVTFELGIIARAVAPSELDSTADAIITRLAANAPLSLKAMKALLVREMQFRDAIPHSDIDTLVDAARTSSDAQEGITARLEKRAPAFHGR